MHRRLIGLLLILSVMCIGWGPTTIYVKPSSAIDYTTTITVFLGAEGTCAGCPGDTYTLSGTEDYDAGGDTTALFNNNGTLESGSPMNGTNSFDFPGAADRLTGFTLTDGTNWEADGGYLALKVKYNSAWCTTGNDVVHLFLDGDNKVRLSCYLSGADEGFRLRIEENNVEVVDINDATAGRYAADQEIKLILVWKTDAGAGTDYVKLYKDTTLVASNTATDLNSGSHWDSFDELIVGDNAGIAGDKHIDNVIIGTDNTVPVATISGWLDEADYSAL